MSMRGQIISDEYNKMVWIRDKEGREYACYARDLEKKDLTARELTPEERENCLNISRVLGENW